MHRAGPIDATHVFAHADDEVVRIVALTHLSMESVMFKNSLSAAALAAFLTSLGACASHNHQDASPGMISFKVDGMACGNCAKDIETHLAQVPGVKAATVNFETKTANVTLDKAHPANLQQLNAAVEAWRKEHGEQEVDAQCLDPKAREELKKNSAN